jgi:hypothetical protein
MAKPPWADLVQSQSGNGYVEEVVSDVGEHVRTRPGEGFTPPGGGRPTGNTVDNTPVPYHQHEHNQEYGVRDSEELYVAPPAVRPEDGKAPTQPQEFEAVWMDRYLKRTQHANSKPVAPKLILPATYNAASTVDNDIDAMQQQMRAMQCALDAALIKREEEALASKAASSRPQEIGELVIRIPLAAGNEASAEVFEPGKVGRSIDVTAALALARMFTR